MNNSCCPGALDSFFSSRAGTYLRKFRRRGLARETRLLAAGIAGHAAGGETLLDVGCGVGALHLALLQSGASKAVGVDASAGMIDRARSLAHELKLENRTEYIVADFADIACSITPADIVIMDKVLCCYDDIERLLDASARKSRAIVAVSYPRDTFLVRAMFRARIAFSRLFRLQFRPYWHDWRRVGATLGSAGFKQEYNTLTMLWEVDLFRRLPAPAR